MRVVMISKALVVGAYQRKLEELAKWPDVELIAIVPPAWGDRRGRVAVERAHVRGYELLVAPILFNGSYHLHFYPTLGRLLRRLRPDIVHMDEEPYNAATWHALRLAQAVGARGLFFTWQNLNRRYPWPFRFFEQANYRRARWAIAGNRAAADVLAAKGYCGPITVIPQFGVDPELFCPAPAGRPADAPFRIGYAGGLIPEKGVDLLLRACAALPDRRWQLVLLGEGPERDRLGELAAALHIAEQVLFLGRRSSTEMPAIYRTFDVLVLPSLSRPNWIEQFGRVLVEAMACGVPVIGSSCGEIPNVIGEAGLIFPEGDVAALRAALAGLMADDARRRELAAAGRARVLAHFTQAQVAAATYQVYCALLVQ
ncbi:MAG: glycosyltransferase [Anaerolineae bacterium]|nr:glycosyltransferase [Anaerolineae bacterium]